LVVLQARERHIAAAGARGRPVQPPFVGGCFCLLRQFVRQIGRCQIGRLGTLQFVLSFGQTPLVQRGTGLSHECLRHRIFRG
jgi:hypothetical protein